MLFLLTVVLVAVKLGRGPAVLAAFVSVATFDFFFVPPRFSFAVTDFQYLLTFAVMLAVALIIGQMTAGLRYQARVASYREERARVLYEFARDMSSLLLTDDVIEAATKIIANTFRAKVAILVPDNQDRIQLRRHRAADLRSTPARRSGPTTSRSPRVPARTRSPETNTCICRCGRRCARAACWRSSRTIRASYWCPNSGGISTPLRR